MVKLINKHYSILELCFKQIISFENKLLDAQKNFLKTETPCSWCYCFIYFLFVIIICLRIYILGGLLVNRLLKHLLF